jgi:hypothetical protein
MAPDTQLGVLKNGSVLVGKEITLNLAEGSVIAPKNLRDKDGWPVAIIPTPSGKQMITFVKSSTLKGDDINLILEGFKAFWDVRNNKSKAKPESLKAVQYFYEGAGSEYVPGSIPAFSILREYVNNYLAYLSGREYDPVSTKKGAVQFNITDKGELTLWSNQTGSKDQDLVYAKDLDMMERNKLEDRFRTGLVGVYYNTKVSEKGELGLNDPLKVKFVTYTNRQFKQTAPMTYNELQFDVLQTNIKGRPVQGDAKGEWIYFDNPTSTFTFVDLPMKEQQTSTEGTTKGQEALAAPSAEVVQTVTSNLGGIMDALSDFGDDITADMIDFPSISTKPSDASKAIDDADLKTTGCK